jgi:hypothetical protein
MAEVKKLWCVRDPSDVSEMGDILFELKLPNDLGNYILGTGGPTFRKENHKFYDDAGSAKKDAEARMKARDKGGRSKKASDEELATRIAARCRSGHG